MTYKKKLWMLSLMAILLLLGTSYNRISLLCSYLSLVSNTLTQSNLSRLPAVEKVVRAKEDYTPVCLSYAEFKSPFKGSPEISMEMFPKVVIKDENVTAIFLPPYQYGSELYKWHIKQRQENPGMYPDKNEQPDEYLYESDNDPYKYAKERYLTSIKPFRELVLMSADKLHRIVYNLELKSCDNRDIYFYERGDINGVCYINPTSQSPYMLLDIYETDKRFVQTIVISSRQPREDMLDFVKTIVFSFQFTVETLPGRENVKNHEEK